MINNLTDLKVCPYYYFLNLIKNNPNIVIATYRDFYDINARIQLKNVLSDMSEYQIIYNDCNDIENTISNIFNMNIDMNLIFNATNQLFNLKELTANGDSRAVSLDYPTESKEFNTENEFILYNGLSCFTKPTDNSGN
jgi:hypothetical protein